MGISKSALKRIRTSGEARLRNKSRKTELHSAERKFREAVAAKNADATELAKNLCSKLDKAAKIGAIHSNKADRKKAQVMKLAAQASA